MIKPSSLKVGFDSGAELELRRQGEELRVRFQPKGGEASETGFQGDLLSFVQTTGANLLYLPQEGKLVVVDQATQESRAIPFAAIDNPELARTATLTGTSLHEILRQIIDSRGAEPLLGLSPDQVTTWKSSHVTTQEPEGPGSHGQLLPLFGGQGNDNVRGLRIVDQGKSLGFARLEVKEGAGGALQLHLGHLPRGGGHFDISAAGIEAATRYAEKKAAALGIPLVIDEGFKV